MRPREQGQRDATSRTLLSIGAVQVLVMLVALVRSKVLSTLLGPASFGVVSTIDQTVLTLVSLGALSLPFTALKFMARGHSESPDAFRESYASFFRTLTMLAALTVAVVLLLLRFRPGTFGQDMAPYRTALAIATLGVPAAMLNVLFVNTLAAAQAPATSAITGLLVTGGLALGAIVGEVANGIEGLYAGTIAAGVVTTTGTLLVLRRRLGLRPAGPAVSLVRELRRNPEIVSYSVLIYGAMAAYSLAMLATRYFVFSGLGAVQAGLLQALLSLALTVGAVMAPMSNLFLTPLVNRSIPMDRKVAAADDFAAKMAVLLLCAALPIVLFPTCVIGALYSNRFAAAGRVLFVFIFWQCLYQIANVYLQLLIGLDDVAFTCAVAGITYGVSAALLPVLLPRLGLGGAGVALAIGIGIGAACAGVRLHRKFGCRPSRAPLARAACTLGAIALAGYVFRDLPGERTAVGVATRLSYAFAAITVMWTLLGPTERALVTASAARLWSGRRRVRPSPS